MFRLKSSTLFCLRHHHHDFEIDYIHKIVERSKIINRKRIELLMCVLVSLIINLITLQKGGLHLRTTWKVVSAFCLFCSMQHQARPMPRAETAHCIAPNKKNQLNLGAQSERFLWWYRSGTKIFFISLYLLREYLPPVCCCVYFLCSKLGF